TVLAEMMWPPRDDRCRARPRTARLHDSVPPLVKMISCGLTCRNAANLSRAFSKPVSAALRPPLRAAPARQAAKRLQDWRAFIVEIHRVWSPVASFAWA